MLPANRLPAIVEIVAVDEKILTYRSSPPSLRLLISFATHARNAFNVRSPRRRWNLPPDPKVVSSTARSMGARMSLPPCWRLKPSVGTMPSAMSRTSLQPRAARHKPSPIERSSAALISIPQGALSGLQTAFARPPFNVRCPPGGSAHHSVTRSCGAKYSASPGRTSNASYQASMLRTTPFTR